MAKRVRRERSAGSHCIWPSGVELRYDISAQTRWRWERLGKLPPRDVYIAGELVGWKPETLDRAAAGPNAAASAA